MGSEGERIKIRFFENELEAKAVIDERGDEHLFSQKWTGGRWVVAKRGEGSPEGSPVSGTQYEILAMAEDEKFVKLQDYPE